jgi:hypothetical protein
MLKFDNLAAANIHAHSATSDRDRLLVQLLPTMIDRIVQLELQVNEFGQWRANADTTAIRLNELEDGLGKLHDQTVGDQLAPFDERVLEVLDVRSGTAFEHLEAEIDEKLSDFIDSYSFTEAVAEAVEGSIGEHVKQKLDDILYDAIIDAIGDPEDIVRKGLRSIL